MGSNTLGEKEYLLDMCVQLVFEYESEPLSMKQKIEVFEDNNDDNFKCVEKLENMIPSWSGGW